MSISRPLLHPGQREFPVCNHVEIFFNEAQTKGAIKECTGNLVTGRIDEERRILSATLEQVPLADLRADIRTGLVKDGEFSGFWANWIYDDVWLLARANTDLRITPNAGQQAVPGYANVLAWRDLRRAINSGINPATIGQFTTELKELQRSLGALHRQKE